APTCLIFPSDVLELEYSAPGHAFKEVPSSLGFAPATVTPDPAALRRAADLLNAGGKVAMLVGQGARGCADELTEVADLLGAGATLQALIPLLDHKVDRSWRKEVESDVADWKETAQRRAMTGADPVNPMRIVHELSERLPANAMVSSDSGSSANWYARHLTMR